MGFTKLRLSEPIMRAVASRGYTTPTPIQMKAIPKVLAGGDLLGCAQTGTGKTGAFALPVLHRLSARTRDGRPRRGRRPRALVLCPTRELATQIGESFGAYGRHLPVRHTVVFGGVGQTPQVKALRDGVDVLVATPGRLLDLMEQGIVDLGGIEVLVLDEADRMLDMGFIHDIRKIVRRVPARRQTLLFSATMPDEIRRLADDLLTDPTFVKAARVSTPAESVTQSVYFVTRKNKPVLLTRLLEDRRMTRTLVFTRTKHGADRLVRVLRRSGIDAAAIHGNKSQTARTRALDRFKAGATPVLVATDIASRGIDVEDITHVVNFDLPNEPETYVHRIGRTARAGASGFAYSFCDAVEVNDLRAIERLIRQEIEVGLDHPGLGATTAPAPQARPPRGARPPKPPRGSKPAGRPTRRAGRGRVRSSRGNR